jgi:hypothetical protein
MDTLLSFILNAIKGMGFGGFPIIQFIKYIAFACYPPRPDTSSHGGLVGLSLSCISKVNSLFLWLIDIVLDII